MLEKIEKLYFNKWYSDVTTKEIWDLFWINKASLYYYFKSKEILFLELLEYSFEKFINNLNKSLNKNLDFFIIDYLNYPLKNKNLFAIINHNNICENIKFIKTIKTKQETVFEILYNYFNKNYSFSKEKTFILLSLLDSLSRKKCIYWWCYVEVDLLITEIKNLFIK